MSEELNFKSKPVEKKERNQQLAKICKPIFFKKYYKLCFIAKVLSHILIRRFLVTFRSHSNLKNTVT